MSLKPLWAVMAAFFAVAAVCLLLILQPGASETPDPVMYNDIVQSLSERWGAISRQSLPGSAYHLDYAVLDTDGNLLAATRPGLDTTLTAAVRHRATVLDITVGGRVVGNIILANAALRDMQAQRERMVAAAALLLLLPLLFCGGFALYLRRKLIHPFRRLDSFARQVAAGNLDVPLEMDRQNLFGPFTESFDLMRAELKRAKENESEANRSKKELVASLSHDIKTPVASIQAITELMLVQEQDTAARKNLENIHAKAKQIAQLVENLFHASLAELEKLHVAPVETGSDILPGLIRSADYNARAAVAGVPSCMVMIDRLRLTQVFDNIFSNSYKYAGTAIDVAFSFDGNFLTVRAADSGPGAPEDSLPLLCNKFYRGENAKGKNGSGLGLYLARYLMEQMGGTLACENKITGGAVCGFCVTVGIRLAGRM